MDPKDWIGRTETIGDVVTPGPVAGLCAALDLDPSRPPDGADLPPLWHWLYFLPRPRRSELGTDGHAKRGGFLPPVPLPRRMWAGGQVEFRQSLKVGDAVSRTSTIESVDEKSGRSGRLLFVKVRHEVRVSGVADPAIVEHQDLVYREAAQPGEGAPAGKPAP